jgi:hypothetical protein
MVEDELSNLMWNESGTYRNRCSGTINKILTWGGVRESDFP